MRPRRFRSAWHPPTPGPNLPGVAAPPGGHVSAPVGGLRACRRPCFRAMGCAGHRVPPPSRCTAIPLNARFWASRFRFRAYQAPESGVEGFLYADSLCRGGLRHIRSSPSRAPKPSYGNKTFRDKVVGLGPCFQQQSRRLRRCSRQPKTSTNKPRNDGHDPETMRDTARATGHFRRA